MNISPFLSIRYPCDQALDWVNQQLSRANFRPVQTFDLQEARTGSNPCPCPHHGTDKCDCQMIVLLVYGMTGEPATLILHGNDGETWLSFGATLQPLSDPGLVPSILKALETVSPQA